MKGAHLQKGIPILIAVALIAAFIAAPIAATTMVTVDKTTANAGAVIYIRSDLGKPGNTAKIEFYFDANNNGIDDEGSSWTSIAKVQDGGSNSLIQGATGQIAYRWVAASDLNPGHYLIRITDSDNSTPKVAGVDITSPATPQVSFFVDGSAATQARPAGFVQVQADVSNNCALCHSGDPSTWNSANSGFDEQKMKEHVKADLSGLTASANDTAVPAQMTLGHGIVGWNVQISPYLQEGAKVLAFVQVIEANLTISSRNATTDQNATVNRTTNATNILNKTESTSNTTLTITGISAPIYDNNTVAVDVTVKNRGADLASATYLVFQDLPKEISVDNGGAFDIASNSTAVFSVKIAALSSASGNYDLKFHATSGNVTSENRTIPIQIGNPAVAASKSSNPLPGFEAGLVVAGLVVAAYVITRRR